MAYVYAHPNLIGYNPASANYANAVWFDLHSANYNSKPPLTLIVGAQGSGKTFTLLNLTTLNALQGSCVVGIDWKGDLLPAAELSAITGFHTSRHKIEPPVEQFEDPNITPEERDELRNRNTGILDPFIMFVNDEDPEQTKTDITIAVNAICYALSPKEMEHINIKTAIAECVSDTYGFSAKEQRTMRTFLTRLMILGHKREDTQIQDYAGYLQHQLTNGSGKMLAAIPGHPPNEKFTVEPGITIIDLSALPGLPKTAEDLKNPAMGVGQAIIAMLALYVQQTFMRMERNIRKTFVIDEAWAIICNPIGGTLIDMLTRLGRSRNVAVLLGSQSFTDLFNDRTDFNSASVSTYMAFNNSIKDALVGLQGMGIEEEEQKDLASIFPHLSQGCCLMQDHRRRRGLVQHWVWDNRLAKLYNSNPNTKPNQNN